MKGRMMSSATLVKIDFKQQCDRIGCNSQAVVGFYFVPDGRVGKCYCAEHAVTRGSRIDPSAETLIAVAGFDHRRCDFRAS